MSAWPIPDEVVEAIAREMYDHDAPLSWSLWPNAGDRRHQYMCRAADFLTRHRLVRLPEEPDGWLDPVCRNGVPGINTMAYYLTREQATPQDCAAYVLCIPGQPITVGEEENDDQA